MVFFFFFLMIRRPPRSTLFPTRRSSDLARQRHHALTDGLQDRITGGVPKRVVEFPELIDVDHHDRSEEHTSELQSRLHLVCRLLLEKKKHYIYTAIRASCQ